MIKEINYANRIAEYYLFVERISRHALDAGTQMVIAKEMTDGLKETVIETFSKDEFFISPPTAEQKRTVLSKIDTDYYFKNLNKVARYVSWVNNYSLVMMCGIFEGFLAEALREVIGLGKSTQQESIFSEFIINFEKKPIESKINSYNKILGIKRVDFFNFSHYKKEIELKYKSFDRKKLLEIFQKRNDAAHSDKAVVSQGELSEISDVLQKIIYNVALKIYKKYGIATQFSEMRKGNDPKITT